MQQLPNPPYLHRSDAENTSLTIQQEWKSLWFFNLYRTVLSAVFLITYSTEVAPNFFGTYDSQLYIGVAVSYLSFAILIGIAIHRHWFPLNLQVFVQGMTDILAITLLMHASGGVGNGLGMLLVVSIAGSSLLTEGRTAFFFAAVASLAILTEAVFADIYNMFISTNYTQAGLLGASFFATAFLAHTLAQRIRANEALAKQRGVHLEYLSQLNEQIVQHIRSGILVLDAFNQIQLCNEAALRFLGKSSNENENKSQLLQMLAPDLMEPINAWKRGQRAASHLFRPEQGEVDVIASFSRLQWGHSMSILILLEDATLTTQRAQQLKLASLGRLTASIAHEVRNPLAAISQAGQLLQEAPQLDEKDKDLADIIVEHCQRVNTIVENVLQLSRQREPNLQSLELNQWLAEFVEELLLQHGLNPTHIQLTTLNSDLFVCFDPTQLHQCVWNLCENALRYSQGVPALQFNSGILPESKRPYLDIQDYGPGMSEEVLKQVFEPFFTTHPKGTGLGLYIAREMCANNRASLHLLRNSAEGCCFRISFSVTEDIEKELIESQ